MTVHEDLYCSNNIGNSVEEREFGDGGREIPGSYGTLAWNYSDNDDDNDNSKESSTLR